MEFEEKEDFQPETPKLEIYSKWAILGFSIFFSLIVGSVLMLLNLRRAGNKKAGYIVLLFRIAFMVIEQIVLIKFAGLPLTNTNPQTLLANPKIIYYSKAMDVLGAAILTEYFFRKYFPVNNYTSRSIWTPLLVLLLLAFVMAI